MDDIASLLVERSIVEAHPDWFCSGLGDEIFAIAGESNIARSTLIDLAALQFFSMPIEPPEKNTLSAALLSWLVQPKEKLESQFVHIGAVALAPVIRGQIQRLQAKRWREVLQENYAEVIKLRPDEDACTLKEALIPQLSPFRQDLVHGVLKVEYCAESLQELLYIIGVHELYHFVLSEVPPAADRLKLLVNPEEFHVNWLSQMDASEIKNLIAPWIGKSPENKAVAGGVVA